MIINIAERETFIPTTNGNDKAESPIAFHLRFLTVEDQTEWEYFTYSQNGTSPSLRVKYDAKFAFLRGVESIDNLANGDIAITTAKEFLALRGPKWMSEMVKEVALHLKDSMEIDEKN